MAQIPAFARISIESDATTPPANAKPHAGPSVRVALLNPVSPDEGRRGQPFGWSVYIVCVSLPAAHAPSIFRKNGRHFSVRKCDQQITDILARSTSSPGWPCTAGGRTTLPTASCALASHDLRIPANRRVSTRPLGAGSLLRPKRQAFVLRQPRPPRIPQAPHHVLTWRDGLEPRAPHEEATAAG